MMERCGVPHPTFPIKCVAPASYRTRHEHHFARHNGAPVNWPNPEFETPEPKRSRSSEKRTLTAMKAMAAEITRKEGD